MLVRALTSTDQKKKIGVGTLTSSTDQKKKIGVGTLTSSTDHKKKLVLSVIHQLQA